MGRAPKDGGPDGGPHNPASSGADAPGERGGASAPDNADDIVMGFRTVRSGVMGRLVRMGSVADDILSRHDYPEPVVAALGQALLLATLLGAPLKEGARLILQTRTDGPLRFLVCQYESPGQLRGYASFDADRVAAHIAARRTQAELLGSGHLAMTVDAGGARDRYQGIVALGGEEDLEAAALNYFRQSEQLPTFLKLGIARQYVTDPASGTGRWRWRAGGLLVQHLSPLGGTPPPPETRSGALTQDGEEERMLGEDDDHWTRVRLLAETVEVHELIDPSLSSDRLLYRLFHEEGIFAAVEPTTLSSRCRCSRERVADMLESFGADELADMREPDGNVSVTCEFCNTNYRFALDQIGAAKG